MGRGIFFGAVWGFLIGALVLAVASLLGDVPGRGAPEAAVVEVPAGSGFDQAGEDRPVEVVEVPPSSEPVGDAPLVTAPEAPVAPALSGGVTTSAAVPETGGVDTLAPPPAGAADSGVDVRVEAPTALESGNAMAVPAEDAPVSPEVTTEAAEVPVVAEPEVAEPKVAQDRPDEDGTEETPAAVDAPQASNDTEVMAAAEEPVSEAPEASEPAAAETEPAVEEVAEAPAALAQPEAPADTTETETAGAAAPRTAEISDAETVGTADVATADVDTVETADAETADAETVEIADAAIPEANSGGFGDRATGITVNRAAESSAEADQAEAQTASADVPEANTDPRALVRNADTGDWPGADGRPLFSIILIDEAGDAALLGALASFEGPLTFALPASAPETARRTYRDAGYEVAVIADIPEGAQPADIEVTVEATLNSVPEAMAVLDGSLSGFRGNRGVSAQVADILAESGHGLITFEQGLGTAVQEARRAGVPTATIFRDLDQNGLGNSVIRRFLDQAAFRAGQDGGVVLLARMRPETISALLIWHKQDRASRVNLAPLSAKLLGGGQG